MAVPVTGDVLSVNDEGAPVAVMVSTSEASESVAVAVIVIDSPSAAVMVVGALSTGVAFPPGAGAAPSESKKSLPSL